MNDSRNQGPRRRICDELAERLDSDAGMRQARLAELAALPPEATEPAEGDRPSRSEGPRPISIWQPVERDGELLFERPEPGPLGDHYAARRRILAAAPPGVRRIAFFGESAAAGYLYAPHWTPARELEARLGAAYEVVDLARTNETLGPLARTVEASLQLRPDLLVIFAGNNTELLETPEVSPYAPAVVDRQRFALALASGGAASPEAVAHRRLRRRVSAAMERIAGAGLPVILVLPEVNLADWSSRQPPPWLPGDGTARWHGLYEQALERLKNQDFDGAAATAREMIALDGGRGPASRRLLGEAERGRGDLEAAARALRAEVDEDRYCRLAFLGAPRATTAVRGLLATAAEEHGFTVVDLAEVFRPVSPLPDRRLFLDYCHLTLEGMGLAMAAVATEVKRHLPPERADEDADPSPAARVSPEVTATACLGAAVHTAHRLLPVGEKKPLLESWCRQALAASPGIAQAMEDLLLARASCLPAVLTAAQQRNLASPYRLLLQHGWRWENLDFELLEVLLAVLEEAGHEIRPRVLDLLVENHGVSAEERDLSRPPYLWEPLERFFPEVMDLADLDERATHRSPWPVSRFGIVVPGSTAVHLRLTARLPAIPGAEGQRWGSVSLRIDGHPVAEALLRETWSRHDLHLPAALLPRGIHCLSLHWPLPPPLGSEARRAALRRLEEGVEADLRPVFGEVFSLRAGVEPDLRPVFPLRTRPFLEGG